MLLHEQQLQNLESLIASYTTLKGSQTREPITTVRNLYSSDTYTTTSQPNNEEGLLSEVKELLLVRMLSILDLENDLYEDEEESTPEVSHIYLDKDEAEMLMKLNSNTKMTHKDWEEGEYIYYDSNEQSFVIEDGELFGTELEESDGWIVL